MLMQRIQENKLKKRPRRDEELTSCRSHKPSDKLMQSSTPSYLIKVITPKQENLLKDLKGRSKPHKKVRYLSEEIEKSQNLLPVRPTASKREIGLKVSTLDNLEDLNIYSKNKSSRKECKGAAPSRKNDKSRQNVKNNTNGNIKMRTIKSSSKSHKKLTLQALHPKSIQKSKSFCKSKQTPIPEINKDISHQCPEIPVLESSYYFSNFETPDPPKKEEITKAQHKKGMFLFESQEQEWREPIFRLNLEQTVEVPNW